MKEHALFYCAPDAQSSSDAADIFFGAQPRLR